ncbi:MAG: acetyltransferase [Chromatiales bacterium]|jgi:hypothetical protein
MYLKEKSTGHMVEVLSLSDLFDPFRDTIVGRYHFGEEMQEPETFRKDAVTFLSDENLPACWRDPHYRDKELKHSA